MTMQRDQPGIPGWHLAGSHPNEYRHGVSDEQRQGGRVAFLRFTADAEPSGFGTVMQTIDAIEHRSKRVRFSGQLRTTGSGWAGLWMRVDEPNRQVSAFDNMQDRPVTGEGDWTDCEVVLDVGPRSADVAFGILLGGAGEVRIAGLSFEVVGDDVPTTGGGMCVLHPRPQNLDFSAG
jgi:hypothetical protein